MGNLRHLKLVWGSTNPRSMKPVGALSLNSNQFGSVNMSPFPFSDITGLYGKDSKLRSYLNSQPSTGVQCQEVMLVLCWLHRPGRALPAPRHAQASLGSSSPWTSWCCLVLRVHSQRHCSAVMPSGTNCALFGCALDSLSACAWVARGVLETTSHTAL